MDYSAIKKYLELSEQDYKVFPGRQSTRIKLLSPYEDFVKARLDACVDASAAQLQNLLKEHFKVIQSLD